jgi:hypothetical protein
VRPTHVPTSKAWSIIVLCCSMLSLSQKRKTGTFGTGYRT